MDVSASAQSSAATTTTREAADPVSGGITLTGCTLSCETSHALGGEHYTTKWRMGRPRRNWIDTVREDLKDIGMSWDEEQKTEKTDVSVWPSVISMYAEPRTTWILSQDDLLSQWWGNVIKRGETEADLLCCQSSAQLSSVHWLNYHTEPLVQLYRAYCTACMMLLCWMTVCSVDSV